MLNTVSSGQLSELMVSSWVGLRVKLWLVLSQLSRVNRQMTGVRFAQAASRLRRVTAADCAADRCLMKLAPAQMCMKMTLMLNSRNTPVPLQTSSSHDPEAQRLFLRWRRLILSQYEHLSALCGNISLASSLVCTKLTEIIFAFEMDSQFGKKWIKEHKLFM